MSFDRKNEVLGQSEFLSSDGHKPEVVTLFTIDAL